MFSIVFEIESLILLPITIKFLVLFQMKNSYFVFPLLHLLLMLPDSQLMIYIYFQGYDPIFVWNTTLSTFDFMVLNQISFSSKKIQKQ